MNFVYTILAVTVITMISLVGAVALAFKPDTLKKVLFFMVAFSVGALIGDSFLHLLPESIESGKSEIFISLAVFAGVLTFFILEKFLRWRHCHDISCHDHPRHLGVMNLVGDGLHNIIDGILVGTSFAVSIPLGISTSLAVILHEIPQELGDFSILLHSGFTIKKAVVWNFLSAFLAFFSAIAAFLIGSQANNFIAFMVPFTVGTFIYIAMSDLIPELHRQTSLSQTISQIGGLLLGMVMMIVLVLFE